MPSLRPALDRSYHYPPDVLELLVDTIPRLIKSKAGLLDFFEQAGTPEELLAEWRTKLHKDRMSVSKYHLARVLRGLNALGDEARPVRHQVLSRLAAMPTSRPAGRTTGDGPKNSSAEFANSQVLPTQAPGRPRVRRPSRGRPPSRPTTRGSRTPKTGVWPSKP